VEGDTRPIHIVIDADSSGNEAVQERREADGDRVVEYRRLRVRPYARPLDDAPDKAAWWDGHRPLILQTACVGPIDYRQRALRIKDDTAKRYHKAPTTFQGARLITIDGEHISQIRYVDMAQITRGLPPGRRPFPEDPGVIVPAKPRPSTPPPAPQPAPVAPAAAMPQPPER
jgi:hypothetical protein